jgi:hypothetical protein
MGRRCQGVNDGGVGGGGGVRLGDVDEVVVAPIRRGGIREAEVEVGWDGVEAEAEAGCCDEADGGARMETNRRVGNHESRAEAQGGGGRTEDWQNDVPSFYRRLILFSSRDK